MAPMLKTSTAAAPQSFATLICGCSSGCRRSASCSSAVLKSSAASTATVVSATKAHQTGAGRNQASAAKAAAAAIECVRKLLSVRIAYAMPARANRRRCGNGRFFIRAMTIAHGNAAHWRQEHAVELNTLAVWKEVLAWSDLIDLKVCPVVDDATIAKALGKQPLHGMAACRGSSFRAPRWGSRALRGARTAYLLPLSNVCPVYVAFPINKMLFWL